MAIVPLKALVALILTMSISAAVKIEKVAYRGWPNCYRLSNGEVDLIVTSDVGPRVIRYGFVGGQNVFKEFDEQMGHSGENKFMLRGGHRIWIAPEDLHDTYALDNTRIDVKVNGDTVVLTGKVEKETGLQKEISVKLAAAGSAVEVRHRIKNTAAKPRRMAPWALTMMAQGGTAITGFPPRGTHPEDLPPTNPLVMWAFTDLTDKRWIFTKKYLLLHQDRNNHEQPQKLGHFNRDTWGAYLLGSDLFIKRYKADASQPYPDFQSSFETFTNAEFLEMETLGPLRTVNSGEATDHLERWTLHRNIKIPSWTDASIDQAVLPLLKDEK